jgi:hypothetical protein
VTETEGVRELLERAGVSPGLRALLNRATRQYEAIAEPGQGQARLLEATGLEREARLRQRYGDADAFLHAWQSGER